MRRCRKGEERRQDRRRRRRVDRAERDTSQHQTTNQKPSRYLPIRRRCRGGGEEEVEVTDSQTRTEKIKSVLTVFTLSGDE